MLRSMRFARFAPLAVAAVLGCSAESEPDEATSAASGVTQSDGASGYTFRVDGDLHSEGYLLAQPAHLEGAFDLVPHGQWSKSIRNLTYKMTLDKNEWFSEGELTSMDPSFTPDVYEQEWKDTHPGYIDFTWQEKDDVVIVIDSQTVVGRSDKGTVLGRGIEQYGSKDRTIILELQGYCDRTMTKCKLGEVFSGVRPSPHGNLFQFVPSSPLRLTPKAR